MMRERTYTPEQMRQARRIALMVAKLPEIDKRYILGYMEGRASGFIQEEQSKDERAGETGI